LKAKELQIETHCFAWDEGAVCKEISDFFYPISIVEKEAISKICRDIQIDGITTIATDLPVPTISYVANQLGLTANSCESALICTNKWMMRIALHEAGIKIPSFFLSDHYNQIDRNEINFPLIIKPTDRSGSRGVSIVNSQNDFDLGLSYALENSIEKKAIVEEYISGDEISVETISWRGKHYILGVTDKTTTGPPYFVEVAHHQPSKYSKYLFEKIRETTFSSLNALGIKYGASHSEFKISPRGEIYVIEVGARMGGDFIGSHLVSLSTGYDFVKGCIEVALGEFTVPQLRNSKFSGIYFLCNETKKIFPYFQNENHFDYEKIIHTNLLKNITNSNERSGYLIYHSDSKIDLF
jgi:biotin carboxylase